MGRGLIGLALLLWAATAQAQTVTGYQLAVYLQGGVSPTTTYDIPAAAVTCGQPRVTVTGTQANPTRARWNDPANAAADCVWTDTGTGPLLGLPFNPTAVYEATVRAVNAAGVSGESPRSNPFTRPGSVPSAPAGLRIGG